MEPREKKEKRERQMQYCVKTIEGFQKGEYDTRLKDVYVDERFVEKQKLRYIRAMKQYVQFFSDGEVGIFSAPGRTEVCGNHTDHQHGKILAAPIHLDVLAVAGVNGGDTVEFVSEGYDKITISIADLEMREEEVGQTAGLVRGVLKGLKDRGYAVGGFNAYTTSDVLIGSGLSSSAAFENAVGAIVSGLFNDNAIDAGTLAQVSQFAENVYFKKPCGLMDQMASAVGGFIYVDFQNPVSPSVEKLEVDFEKHGYSICIVDTKGSHVDLTDDYASIPLEMKKVAGYFHKEVLRDCNEEEVYAQLAKLREVAGDRAVLRAIHFFREERNVENAVQALQNGDINTFLSIIKASGNSSFQYLQNVYTTRDVHSQNVSVALAYSETLLSGGYGVCRVHGGGFAGTIQAFVKNEFVETYKTAIESVFGEGACHVLKIRKYGSIAVL